MDSPSRGRINLKRHFGCRHPLFRGRLSLWVLGKELQFLATLLFLLRCAWFVCSQFCSIPIDAR